jgi:cation transport ATPase
MEPFVHNHKWNILRIIVIAIALIFRGLNFNRGMAPFDFVSLFAVLIGGYPIFEETLESIKKRRFLVYLPVTLAVLTALCLGKFSLGLIISLAGMTVLFFRAVLLNKE